MLSRHFVIFPNSDDPSKEVEVLSITNFEPKAVIHKDSSSDVLQCFCGMFATIGIPCCHLICYLMSKRISIIPLSLICNKWRFDAKPRVVDKIGGSESNLKFSLRSLCNEIFS